MLDFTATARTATAAPRATAVRRRARFAGPRLDPYWLAALLFAAYASLSVCRFRRMDTMSWDLGIFEQAVRGYAHLRAPVTDIKAPGFNILGDHFSPVTALIAPAYRLWPSAVTLLVAQAALFALSAVPVTRAAARVLGRRGGLALGAAYGLSWGIQRAVDFDFHEVCFAVPLIAFALEAVLRHRWYAALWWAAPLVLVKEDLGVTAAAIGLVVALRARREDPRAVLYAVGLAAFGVVACEVELTYVIPAFNSAGHYDYWVKMSGDTSGSVLAHLLAGAGQKLRTLLWVLLPTGGLLALRSPLLLAALPTLAWRFASGDDHYWSTAWHYNAVLMPVVALALTDALGPARRSGRPWLRAYAVHAPAASLAAALALSTSLPLADLTHPAGYEPGTRAAAAARVLSAVPDRATVEANVGTLAHLTNRCRVLWVTNTRGILPRWIALEETGKSASQVLTYVGQLHPGATYRIVSGESGYWVLRRF